MQEKISIIIPVYNAEKYIKYCVESILEQTYQNFEIIAVLDGGNDNSEKILENLKNKSNKIKIIKQKNQGAMSARKTGIENATGTYIMFVDSDDWIKKDMLENMIKRGNNSDVIKCGVEKEEGTGILRKLEIVKEDTKIHKKDFNERLYPILFTTNYLNNIYSQLIKRNIVKTIKYNTNLRVAEDLNFVIELYQSIKTITILPDTYYHYKKNEGSTVNTINYENVKKDLDNVIEVFGKIFYLVRDKKITTNEYKKKAYLYVFKELTVYTTKVYYLKGNYDERSIFNKAFESQLYKDIIKEISQEDIKKYSSGVKHIMKLFYKNNVNLMLTYGKWKTLLAYKTNFYIKKIKGDRNERFS